MKKNQTRGYAGLIAKSHRKGEVAELGPIADAIRRAGTEKLEAEIKRRRNRAGGSESKRRVEGALRDWYLDSEERPKMAREFQEVKALVYMHLGVKRGSEWFDLHKRMDKALRSKLDPDESGLVRITEQLSEIYSELRDAVIG